MIIRSKEKKSTLLLFFLVFMAGCESNSIKNTKTKLAQEKTKTQTVQPVTSKEPILVDMFNNMSCEEKKSYLTSIIEDGASCNTDAECAANNSILICGITSCMGDIVNNTVNISALKELNETYYESCNKYSTCACNADGFQARCISGSCQYIR